MKIGTLAIVQARMGSSRFPGKMLANLGDMPLLEWVLRRLTRSNLLDQIVVATSESQNDNFLADLVLSLGLSVYRGSEDDVLSRFVGAIGKSDVSKVVRVCADNPFIDPFEIDRLIKFFDKESCDYACNHQDRLGSLYADGFGAEIFNIDVLKVIDAEAKEKRFREHATLYIWENSESFKLKAVPAPVELSFPYLRFDVDTPYDLQKLQKLVDAGVTIKSAAAEIISLARQVKLENA